jgi:hypothetical protein
VDVEEGVGGVGLEVSLAGGRRDRTDQVGFERRAKMSNFVLGEALRKGVVDALTECIVDLFVMEL